MNDIWWDGLNAEERRLHYNRYKKCKHDYEHPEDDRLIDAHSFDPYSKVSHDDVKHSVAGFFAGTCECHACLRNVGLERGSPYEYDKRKLKIVKLIPTK